MQRLPYCYTCVGSWRPLQLRLAMKIASLQNHDCTVRNHIRCKLRGAFFVIVNLFSCCPKSSNIDLPGQFGGFQTLSYDFRIGWYRNHPEINPGGYFLTTLNSRKRFLSKTNLFKTNYSKRLRQPLVDLVSRVYLKHLNSILKFSKS